MRKLVRVDREGWFMEIDPKALRREAQEIKAYCETAPPVEAMLFAYRMKIMPLVEAALDGTLPMPYRGEMPYPWRLIYESVNPPLTEGFMPLYVRFMNRISGGSPTTRGPANPPDFVIKDGERYEWVDFED